MDKVEAMMAVQGVMILGMCIGVGMVISVTIWAAAERRALKKERQRLRDLQERYTGELLSAVDKANAELIAKGLPCQIGSVVLVEAPQELLVKH